MTESTLKIMLVLNFYKNLHKHDQSKQLNQNASSMNHSSRGSQSIVISADTSTTTPYCPTQHEELWSSGF